jgi:hypothetical protein
MIAAVGIAAKKFVYQAWPENGEEADGAIFLGAPVYAYPLT